MTNIIYDYIVIGGGPSGLVCCYILALNNYNVLLIEKEKELGGCHRVINSNNLFSEHGPRIYMNNYVNTMNILNHMGINWNDIFAPYYSIFGKYLPHIITTFSLKEWCVMIITFILFLFTSLFDHWKSINMYIFMKQFSFSTKTINLIDLLCRFTDGGTMYNYTLYEFLQIINQNLFYSVYEPKLPNDQSLILKIEQKLNDFDNVTIIKEFNVENIEEINNIYNINSIYHTLNIILAIPPIPLYNLLKNCKQSKIQNVFQPLNELYHWSKLSKYLKYKSYTLHFNTKINFQKEENNKYILNTNWGIVTIGLSDIMQFSPSISVLSVAITKPEKIPNNYTENDIKKELYNQLKLIYPKLPYPTHFILGPQQSAFILTSEGGYASFNNQNNLNIYSVGTHLGFNNYAFTSFESAVENAIKTMNCILQKETFKHQKIIWTCQNIIVFLLIIYLTKLILFKQKLY